MFESRYFFYFFANGIGIILCILFAVSIPEINPYVWILSAIFGMNAGYFLAMAKKG